MSIGLMTATDKDLVAKIGVEVAAKEAEKAKLKDDASSFEYDSFVGNQSKEKGSASASNLGS